MQFLIIEKALQGWRIKDTINDNNYYCYGSDDKNDIEKCLNCEKSECDNCLYYLNRV